LSFDAYLLYYNANFKGRGAPPPSPPTRAELNVE